MHNKLRRLIASKLKDELYSIKLNEIDLCKKFIVYQNFNAPIWPKNKIESKPKIRIEINHDDLIGM